MLGAQKTNPLVGKKKPKKKKKPGEGGGPKKPIVCFVVCWYHRKNFKTGSATFNGGFWNPKLVPIAKNLPHMWGG